MKKFVSLAVAGIMAASLGVSASADNPVAVPVSALVNTAASDTEAELRSALIAVKQRISVPEEISQFSYSVDSNALAKTYYFYWDTPAGSENYKCVNAVYSGGVITSYGYYDYSTSSSSGAHLAKLSSAELYAKAVKAVRTLNPTVAPYLRVVSDSIYMTPYDSTASFTVQRVKNGVPVENDRGKVYLNKDTGEVTYFNLNWHRKASFKSKDNALSADEAWDSYCEMISPEPQYEIYYDYENDTYATRLVYVQDNYGDINAFTGKKSDFRADGYFDKDGMFDEDCEVEEPNANPETGAGDFTTEELRELSVPLPYAKPEAVIDILDTNKFLFFSDELQMSYDYLFKDTTGGEEKYFYTISFTNSEKEHWDYENENPVAPEEKFQFMHHDEVSLCVNAQTGEIINYHFYTSDDSDVDSYDLTAADKKAAEALKSLSPKYAAKFSEQKSSTDEYVVTEEDKNKTSTTVYCGSNHNFTRKVNGIRVIGNDVQMHFDGKMRLRNYSINYTDVSFDSTKKMLAEEQILDKFRESAGLKLCYKAGSSNKKTMTVLVYSAEKALYVDAFTGEPVYSNASALENDLSGISDSDVLRRAEALSDNGIVISSRKFSENDAVYYDDFARLIGFIGNRCAYNVDFSEDKQLNRGEAVKLMAAAKFGAEVAELKGIFKSPFADISDSDENVGYYAIAYAAGLASGSELHPADSYTYGEFIGLIYDMLSC